MEMVVYEDVGNRPDNPTQAPKSKRQEKKKPEEGILPYFVTQ